MISDKEIAYLEELAWKNDNFESFNARLKKKKIHCENESVIEEYQEGVLKPMYKRIDLCDDDFISCIFVPLNYTIGE